jgi:predicted nucleic acid-binding protein
MSTMFLDTSGWFAAMSPREAHHAAARKRYQQSVERGTRLLTTNLVVAEMQILLSRARGGGVALQFLDSLYQDPTHTVLFVDRDLERAAVDRWLRRFADQPVSLADAVSFEVMRMNRFRRALTLDDHFRVAGFEMVP